MLDGSPFPQQLAQKSNNVHDFDDIFLSEAYKHIELKDQVNVQLIVVIFWGKNNLMLLSGGSLASVLNTLCLIETPVFLFFKKGA